LLGAEAPPKVVVGFVGYVEALNGPLALTNVWSIVRLGYAGSCGHTNDKAAEEGFR
jgi:hypothetical protein